MPPGSSRLVVEVLRVLVFVPTGPSSPLRSPIRLDGSYLTSAPLRRRGCFSRLDTLVQGQGLGLAQRNNDCLTFSKTSARPQLERKRERLSFVAPEQRRSNQLLSRSGRSILNFVSFRVFLIDVGDVLGQSLVFQSPHLVEVLQTQVSEALNAHHTRSARRGAGRTVQVQWAARPVSTASQQSLALFVSPERSEFRASCVFFSSLFSNTKRVARLR